MCPVVFFPEWIVCIFPLVANRSKTISPLEGILRHSYVILRLSGDSSWLQDECTDIKTAECPSGLVQQY